LLVQVGRDATLTCPVRIVYFAPEDEPTADSASDSAERSSVVDEEMRM